jgi:hypothetical protein
MDHPSAGERIDEKLARLLEVERGLEARVRETEVAAAARVAEAREAARGVERDRETDVEATARAEADVDIERGATERRRIAEEGAARVALLSTVPESVLDRLARRAVAAVLANGEAVHP